MKKNLKYFLITTITLAISLLLLINAGTYLVKKEQLLKADAVLVLMGSIADRVLETNDLYQSNSTKNILIVNNIQYGSEYLAQYNVHIPNGAQLSKQALTQLNIPDSLITIIPSSAASTRAEAEITANWLKQNPQIDTLIIVSSAAHMRRAMMIFEDTFDDNDLNVTLLSVPSKYSGFNAKHWWKHRESAKQVFMEYVKIISFLLVEQWQ
ncbi:MAG: YdcF family protein [Sulfurimonas sp.]|nr:YdcF family protein [Sulfurimonas sp.]